MKIIKYGDLELAKNNHRINKYFQFECESCGCVFEAVDSECEVFKHAMFRRKVAYSAECPTCGDSVAVWVKE